MRKVMLLFFVGAFVATVASCASYRVFTSSDDGLANPNISYTILGPVSVRLDNVVSSDIVGVKEYALSKAKKLYPSADMVVDITYSGRYSYLWGMYTSLFAEGLAVELR